MNKGKNKMLSTALKLQASPTFSVITFIRHHQY